VVGFLVQPLVQPPLALVLLGIDLDISVSALMMRLALFVGGSFIIAALIRWWAGPERICAQGPAIGGVVVLMLVIFAVGVMDGLPDKLLAEPEHVLTIFVAIVAANYGLQALGVLVFWLLAPVWRMSGREGLTAALILGTRNIANLIAILGAAASPDLY